jgi:hypothetical protein
MSFQRSLQTTLRGQTFIGISIGGGIIAAFTAAGVASVPLSKIILIGVWVVLVAEAYFSKWFNRTKEYKYSLLLLVALVSGVGDVYLGAVIANMRYIQDEAARPQQSADKAVTTNSATATAYPYGTEATRTAKVGRPAKSKSPTPTVLQQSPVIIQTAPIFGNIKDRAMSLSDEMMRELYIHGWRSYARPIRPDLVIEQMPQGSSEIGHTQLAEWKKDRSITFKFRFLKRVIDIRDEFLQFHIRNEDLDRFLKDQTTLEEAMKVNPRFQNTISPVDIEVVAQYLKALAEQVK